MTMNTTTFLSGLLLFAGVLTSCDKDDHDVTPSNGMSTLTTSVGEFDQLYISNAFTAYVTFSDDSDAEERVLIEANSNLHPYIRVENHNGQLSIGIDNGINISKGNIVLKAYITAKRIDAFTAEGASSIELQNAFYDETVNIELYGASHFRGTLHAGEITSSIHGASAMLVDGTTVFFHIDATGASSMEGFGFLTGNLETHLEGASAIALTVKDELDVTASGASNVRYKGNGVVVRQQLSGASSIVNIN
jgi:hypothetical protein